MPEEHEISDDIRWLHRYSRNRDEVAFACLVKRHGGMVHGVAMRILRDGDTAKDVTQTVFLALAKKAQSLEDIGHLSAWLHKVATWEARRVLRKRISEQRRDTRMKDHQRIQCEGRGLWDAVSPFFDEAFEKLSAKDREILCLHYLERMRFREIANQIGSTAEAAQKRSVRALEKLAALLRKQGLVVPAITLATCLGTEVARATPDELVPQIMPEILNVTIPAHDLAILISKITTIMQTNKLFALGAVILGATIPMGWQVAFSDERVIGYQRAYSLLEIGKLNSKSTENKITDDQRLRLVFRKLDEAVAPDETLELMLMQLVFTLDLKELAVARQMLREVRNQDRFHGIALMVFARWAELDSEAAILEARTGEYRYNDICLRGAFGTWSEMEPDAAMRWLCEEETIYDHRFIAMEWVERLLTKDTSQAMERMGAILKNRPAWKSVEDEFLGALWFREPMRALGWVKELEEGGRRDRLLEGFIDLHRRNDFLLTLELAEEISSPKLRDEILSGILSEWIRKKPKELLHTLRSLPEENRDQEIENRLLQVKIELERKASLKE